MNLEEVKDSLRTATITGWDPVKSDYIESVTCLLSIIEQAEKGLAISIKQMRDDAETMFAEMGYMNHTLVDSDAIKEVESILKAIRGN